MFIYTDAPSSLSFQHCNHSNIRVSPGGIWEDNHRCGFSLISMLIFEKIIIVTYASKFSEKGVA